MGRFCFTCQKPLRKDNVCGACYKHKHLSPRVKSFQRSFKAIHEKEISLYMREYQRSNLAKCNESSRKYKARNPAKRAALENKRRAQRLNATPLWLTKDHFELMEMFYLRASYLTKMTGIKFEVDHIVPLQGKTVQGLHVPWNLRVITKSENCSKHNKAG